MKRVLTGVTLSLFVFACFSANVAFSENRSKAAIIKDIILKKRELIKNSSKGELYVQALDAYFEKYANNTQKNQDLIEKVSAAKIKLGKSQREQEIKLLIEYIELKGNLIMLNLTHHEGEENINDKDTPYIAVFKDFVKYFNEFDGNSIKDIASDNYMAELHSQGVDLENIEDFFNKENMVRIDFEIVSIQEDDNQVTLGVLGEFEYNIDGKAVYQKETYPDYINIIKINNNWYLDSSQ